MTVAGYRVIPVAFPDPPLRNSTGVHEPYALRTLVRLETAEGLVGWGETYGGAEMAAALQAAAPAVLGRRALEMTPLRSEIPDPRVYSALEVAFLDLAGQQLGVRVSDLLGGAVRDPVEFAAYLFYHFDSERYGECMDTEALLRQARRLVEQHGFSALKLKGGVLPPEKEIEAIRALRREFGPDFRLRLDPNAIWSVETSIRVAAQLEEELEYLEDPTDTLEDMAQVHRAVNLPLSTNMVVTRWSDLPRAAELGSVDVILSDHHYWGGLRATLELSRICETWGWGVSMHSNSHLGISMAAMLHAAAATPHITYACDTHYVWLERDLLDLPAPDRRLAFEKGCMSLPEGPGLGIRVDEDEVARMEEAYHLCGQTRRDDIGYMQRRYDPEWQPLKPRW